MTISVLALVVVGISGVQDRVQLARTYEAGAKSTYGFSSRLDVESRTYGFETFFPVRYLTSYTFTFDVEKQKPEGVADLRFKRPKIEIDVSDAPWGDAAKETLEFKENVLFTLSRANQVLAMKNETPPPPDRKDGGLWLRALGVPNVAQRDIVSSFIQQLYSLAGFVNFFDFGPILPARPVAVGDTWKETKAFAPITVKAGADKGKNMVARLDYEYTYKGEAEWQGKGVTWIQGRFIQDTDAAPYVAELYGYEPAAFPLTSIKLKMDMTVDYYLDPKNHWPLRIAGKSTGEAAISLRGYDRPVEELQMKGEAYLTKK